MSLRKFKVLRVAKLIGSLESREDDFLEFFLKELDSEDVSIFDMPVIDLMILIENVNEQFNKTVRAN